MKKVIGLILVFILVFAVASGALAGSRPKITRQPETRTVKAGGTVSFSIKTTGTVKIITWYFIDPATGESYTGKQLSGVVNGLKVQNPNSSKITLSKVPESMHGWTVYAHVNGNGYNFDSDKAQLLISGMDVSAEEPPAEDSPAAPSSADPDAPVTAEAGPGTEEQVPNPFTVSATSRVLKRLDDTGSAADGDPVSSLEFEGCGDVLVTSEYPIVSWSLNGIRVHPDQPVKSFRITNITTDMLIDLKVQRTAAADLTVDESHMCKVTCRGCTFTYVRGRLVSQTEGEVPAGAQINVSATSPDLAGKGYRINGAEPEYKGKPGFQLIVNEDVEIVCE